MAIVVGALTCILFFISALRAGHISGSDSENYFLDFQSRLFYGLAIAYLLNPIVKAVDRKLLPFLEKKFPNLNRRKACRDP